MWLMKIISQLKSVLTLRRLVIFAAISVMVWLVVVIGLALSIVAYGEMENAETSDVIVVLGSGLRRDGRAGDALYRRSVWGAQLYAQGMAPNIICTGGVGEGQRRSEADACREVLVSQGVPASVIYLEEQSRSTEENAIFSKLIMEENGWQTAILVTDSFHMLRADWIFDLEGFEHSQSPVPRAWVRNYYYQRHFTREILALHWQLFKTVLNLPITSL